MSGPKTKVSTKPTFFATPAAFRKWLEGHHGTEKELLVGFYKRATGKPSLTWPESVDEALCFGWIDGVRRSLGADAYTIRFTDGSSTPAMTSTTGVSTELQLACGG